METWCRSRLIGSWSCSNISANLFHYEGQPSYKGVIMSDQKQKLPPKTEDHIVEVSLKHVVFGFATIIVSSLTVGIGISFVKDYTKFKRQKTILDSVTQLLFSFTNIERSDTTSLWKDKKMVASSSPEKKSNK